MPKLTRREKLAASKFRKYEKAHDQAKQFYGRADALLLELAQFVGKEAIRIRADGRTLSVKDLADSDELILGWGHGAVRRYELKISLP